MWRQLWLACFLTVGATPKALADWNQWRGPDRNGHVPGFQVPVQWPGQLKRRWKVMVGSGHASPLIVGDSVFIFTRVGENEVVRRLRLEDGREVWRHSYPAPYEMNPAATGHGKGPKSTPTYAEGRLYTFGINGRLTALDAGTGRVIWQRDFSGQYAKTSPLYGVAASPLVYNGMVIVHVGGHDQGALTAFDARTGQIRWRWSGDGPAYASPVLATFGGAKMLITQTQRQCVGVDPDTGRLLWSLPFTTPYDQNCVTPVVAGDRVIFGGTQQPTFAVKVARAGTGWQIVRTWQTRDATLYMSTPVAVGQAVYGMTERRSGQMFALDAGTGRVFWTNPGRVGENAAVFWAGDCLIALTTGADLLVWRKQGHEMAEVARYHVAESPTWASPAFSGRRILIKDADALILWEF